MKSKPIGVRFDLDKLELVKQREGIVSHQKVVDFLFDKYIGDSDDVKKLSQTVPKEDTQKLEQQQTVYNHYESESDIIKMIEKIKNEKIPTARDTPLGRKYFAIEQQDKIREIEKHLLKGKQNP